MKTENHYTETDLGNISLNPRGEYDPEAFYEYLDTVSMDGGSYMCLAELGTKITGIPPVPGTNTEHWQVLTLPGGLTPEYITMHDEVTEKAKQVEVSRAAVELSQSEIEAMQADVAQLHKDTQDSAQSALASKNQAAGYASAADTSRQAAERAKQDIDAQIPNIDAKLQAALNDIDDARQNANASVKKQEDLSAQAVKDQTGEYITEQKKLAKQELDQKVDSFNLDVNAIKKQVSDEGAKQVEAVQTAQTTAMKAVETAKSEAVQAVKTEGAAQTGNVTAEGAKQVQAVQTAAQEIIADREQIAQNKTGIETLKQGKADAIVETASGKTIITRDSSSAPIKTLSGKGKIIITGKNILDTEKNNQFIPFAANADTLFTLITNGVKSAGGNIRFVGEDGENVWFAIDSGETKVKQKINKNVKGFYNTLVPKEGLKYCFSVGENDKYEEYVEQVITAPVSAEQLKTIHTNYPITVLTSENEIIVEYVADTETYIGKRIKEENQTLQKQITDLQNALISQKISGGGIKVTDSARLPIKGLKVFGKSIQDGVPSPENPVPIESVGDKGTIKTEVLGGNLIDISLFKDEEKNGVSGKKTEDGGYRLLGKTEVGEYFVGTDVNLNLSPGHYHISDKNITPSNNFRLLIRIVDAKKKTQYYSNGSFEIKEGDTVECYFQVEPNQTVDITLYPMLNAGKEKIHYEPYRKPQSLTLSAPNGLPGIKVDSGGNYTDKDGQQWISDEIDLGRGKYVQRIEHYTSNGHENMGVVTFNRFFCTLGSVGLGNCIDAYDKVNSMCENLKSVSLLDLKNQEKNIAVNDANFYVRLNETTTMEDVISLLTEGIKFSYILKTPIERNLTHEEIAAYKALHTNYPTTTVLNDENADMELTYTVDTQSYVDTKIAEIGKAIL